METQARCNPEEAARGPPGGLGPPAWGGAIQEGFRLAMPGERLLDLLRDTIQWVRGQIMQLGRSARTRQLATHRTSFGHHGSVDWELTRAVWPALTHEQRRDLLRIQSAGL